MTCCSGSPASSASETTKVASFSSSSMVGSALTSFSNCSSGRSGRTFLPSGPISPTATAGVAAASAAAAPVLAGAFFAGAAFLAGAFTAAVFAGAAFFAAVLAGALVAVLAWVVVVVLRAFEDTNTSRQGHAGRGKARCGQEPHCHSAMPLVVPTKWEHVRATARGRVLGRQVGLGGRLLGLLVLAHLQQRRRVGHVGHRAVAVEGVVAHRALPPVGPYAELLGQQRGEDLCLLLAEAWQLHDPLQQVGT